MNAQSSPQRNRRMPASCVKCVYLAFLTSARNKTDARSCLGSVQHFWSIYGEPGALLDDGEEGLKAELGTDHRRRSWEKMDRTSGRFQYNGSEGCSPLPRPAPCTPYISFHSGGFGPFIPLVSHSISPILMAMAASQREWFSSLEKEKKIFSRCSCTACYTHRFL